MKNVLSISIREVGTAPNLPELLSNRLDYATKFRKLFENTEIGANYFCDQEEYKKKIATEKLLLERKKDISSIDIEKACEIVNAELLSLNDVISGADIKRVLDLHKKEFGVLLRNVAYKKDDNNINNLLKILDEVGDFYFKLGKITSDPKYFTDSAVAYNYIISILEKNFDGNSDKKPPKISDPIERLESIQKSIFESIGANYKLAKNVLEEQSDNKKFLEEIRTNMRKDVESFDKYKNIIDQKDLKVKNEKTIFEDISSSMKIFLATLYEEAEKQFKVKPCEYSIIGMGSMALDQITPYSDLEFAIIIDKYSDDIGKYFKDLTHLVHFKVINLGESVIPTSRYKQDMSHLVKRAVNFDLGGKTPLGRIESDKPYNLIGDINWFMKYVRNENNRSEHIDKNLPYIRECMLC